MINNDLLLFMNMYKEWILGMILESNEVFSNGCD